MTQRVWGAAALVFLAACGGGSDESATAASAAAAGPAQTRTAASAAVKLADAATPAQAAEQLLDFAEGAFPAFFPTHQATATLDPFRFRYYAETGVYLGVVVKAGMGYEMDGVYVMGGPFGDTPRHVGPLSTFITPTEPGPGGPAGSSNGCYDLDLLTRPATRITVKLDHTSQVFGTMTLDWSITGTRGFGPHTATETVLKSTGSHIGGNPVDAEEKSYASRSGEAALIQYGSERTTVGALGGMPLTITETVRHTTPSADSRYALAVGGSVTRRLSSTITKTSTGIVGGAKVTTSTRDEDETVRFVAIERISVPAGTYDTCRFEVRLSSAPGVVNTTWVIRGKGIPVKLHSNVNGVEIEQWATSVTLNGSPL